MQNIIEICKEFGIEIPSEKTAEFNKKVTENYVTVSEHTKKLGKAETERDNWKEKAETAEETLKTFEGIDPAQIQKEIDAWKQKAENAEKDYNDKLYQRDFSDALNSALAEYEFTSEAAKKAIHSEITDAGLKLKDGKILGLSDLMAQLKERDAAAFVDKEQKQQEQNKARFTAPVSAAGGKTGTATAEEIMSIKDRSARHIAIAQNKHLFNNKGD